MNTLQDKWEEFCAGYPAAAKDKLSKALFMIGASVLADMIIDKAESGATDKELFILLKGVHGTARLATQEAFEDMGNEPL